MAEYVLALARRGGADVTLEGVLIAAGAAVAAVAIMVAIGCAALLIRFLADLLSP